MKTYKDISCFTVEAMTIDNHYTPIIGEHGDEVAIKWCSVDGISFIIPGQQESISIDSEGHDTAVETKNGRIVFYSDKYGVDEEYYLTQFDYNEAKALEVDFEKFPEFDLTEVHIVADYEDEGHEDIHPELLMITSFEIHFDDNTFVAATNEQLTKLHMSVQGDAIARQLRLEEMKAINSKEENQIDCIKS